MSTTDYEVCITGSLYSPACIEYELFTQREGAVLGQSID